jgi:hypothetical protein
VDAATGTSAALPLPDKVLRAYIGGSGLGAWLLHKLGTPGADALDAGNPLDISGLPDVCRPGVRYVNRQRGAGTRVLLDVMLGRQGLAAVYPALPRRGRSLLVPADCVKSG